MPIPRWQYDEMKHCGVDYADPGVVAEYDANHRRFRDYQADAENIVAALGLDRAQSVIDMGCGTGAFALHAAPLCGKVYAVDVSASMLQFLQTRASQAGLDNIECHQGGFLTYEHQSEPVDAVVSVAVLHHLPDFWKLVGLTRVAAMLRPGGRLHLFDVVFPFGAAEHASMFDAWVASIATHVSETFAEEAATHIREEYSTCDWIMEGILERAGFTIDERRVTDGMPTITYRCTKTGA